MSTELPANPENTGAPSPEAVARTVARHPRPLGGDTQRTTGISKLELTSLVINNRGAEAHHLRLQRKPDWLRARVPGGEGYERLKGIIDEHRLHTVCQEASCPNMGECWGRGTAIPALGHAASVTSKQENRLSMTSMSRDAWRHHWRS